MKYALEIYGPGDRKTAVAVFSSETPFGSIHKGDLLNPVTAPDVTWRVTDVQHVVSGFGEKNSHKILVYTEAVKT